MKTTSAAMKRNYDLRILERTYPVGDVFYILDTAVLKGQCKKLGPPCKGHGVIVTRLSSFIFRVKLRISVFVVNHDRLKPCKDWEIPQWISHWRKNTWASPKQTVTTRGDDRVYCFFRNHWNGRFMIQSDHFKEVSWLLCKHYSYRSHGYWLFPVFRLSKTCRQALSHNAVPLGRD